jgi:hypothetical protein
MLTNDNEWQGYLLIVEEWLVVANVIHESNDGSVYVDYIFHPWKMCEHHVK